MGVPGRRCPLWTLQPLPAAVVSCSGAWHQAQIPVVAIKYLTITIDITIIVDRGSIIISGVISNIIVNIIIIININIITIIIIVGVQYYPPCLCVLVLVALWLRVHVRLLH